MGAFTSRSNAGVEEVDIASNNAYRYPPKMGNYFGTYFIMGGERFDMSQPEAYLFGENTDLNFLGNKPIPFPYPTPTGNEPTKTLKSLVNIRKDSLRFVKIEDEMAPVDDSSKVQINSRYNLEFTFDSDVRCAITVYYFATEDISNGQIMYHPKDKTMNSETFHYKRGTNQLFSQASHVIEPGKFQDDEWHYSPSKEIIPIVIQCNVEEEEHAFHSHITFACVEKSSVDGSYMVKPLKQKQFVDGLPYLLQEIYGIENKQTDQSKIDPDDEVEDSGAECVICMSDMRDTLILPCRHLCLCSTCAESLRYQASNCPICRSPFRALLQIRAMRRKQPIPLHQGETEDIPVSQEGVPSGYEAVALIEALNGPCNQLFSVGEGFLPPMRLPPIDTDTYHREKKRSSKSKDQNVNQNVMLKSDDKKMLEEEERKTQMVPEVVMTTETSTDVVPGKSPKKKDLPKVVYPDQKDCTDDSKTSDSTEDCHLPTNLKREELKVYDLNESEADSDYELKPIQINTNTRLSMEDLADDEREDTSEGEPEPEPDYDDDATTRTEETDNVQVAASYRSSSQPDIMIEDQATYIQGFSRSAGDINIQDGRGYQMLRLEAGNVSLPGSAHGSTSLEASSFSSTTSSRGLLVHGGNITDEDKE